MNVPLIGSYVLIFLLCVATVSFSFRLYDKFRLKFLYFYLYYIIVHNILGFFYLFGIYLNNQLLFFSFESKDLVTQVLGFLVYPFIPVMLFMFINFATGLIDKRFPKSFRNVFFVFWGILILVYMFVAGRSFSTRDNSLLKGIWDVTYLLEGITLLAATSYLLVKSRQVTDKKRGKAISTIGLMYFIILASYAVLFLQVIKPTLYFFLILHFSFNILPLVYLGIYLKKHHVDIALPRIDEGDLDSFFDEHNITRRESEILMLLLKGKRTRDIEKELFISYHTVKNHIHNIYQKLHVKNRLQIASLLRDHLDRSRQ